MKIIIKFPDPTPTPLPGLYVYALHDFECEDFFRRDWGYSVPRSLISDRDKLDNAKGYPAMVPLKPRVGVKLTERLQWFWVKQLALSAFGIHLVETENRSFRQEFYGKLTRSQQLFVKDAWHGLTRDDTAFTNGRGTWSKSGLNDPCRDYILEKNLSAEYPMLWENTCTGHTMRVNSQTIPVDAEWIEIKTLKTDQYPVWKNWNFLDHKEFFTFATNSTPYKVGTVNTVTKTGPWKVEPMHFLGGKDVPVPLMSNTGMAYAARSRVKILGQIFRHPYSYNM